jgi:prepilin-type N-terminal cleavage/methylation domain-containing protein
MDRMPTSATTKPPSAIPSARRGAHRRRGLERAAGFTLLEVLIVAFLIGILSVLFMPRIGKRFGFDLDNAGEIMSAELRYAAERAVATGETHRLLIDLDEQRMRLERVELLDPPADFELPGTPSLLDLVPPKSTRESKPVAERQGDWHSFEIDGVRIDAVVIGDEEFTEKQAAITFSGDGGADPAVVRIADDTGDVIRLEVQPFTAEVKVARASDE